MEPQRTPQDVILRRLQYLGSEQPEGRVSSKNGIRHMVSPAPLQTQPQSLRSHTPEGGNVSKNLKKKMLGFILILIVSSA